MLAPYVSCIVVVVFSGRNRGKLLIRYWEKKEDLDLGENYKIWINIQISLGNDIYTSMKYFSEKYKKKWIHLRYLRIARWNSLPWCHCVSITILDTIAWSALAESRLFSPWPSESSGIWGSMFFLALKYHLHSKFPKPVYVLSWGSFYLWFLQIPNFPSGVLKCSLFQIPSFRNPCSKISIFQISKIKAFDVRFHMLFFWHIVA